MEKTATEILLEAANLAEQTDKWCKGYFVDSRGCMCAHGMISYCGDATVRHMAANDEYTDANELSCKLSYARYESGNILVDDEFILKKFGQVGLASYKAAKVGLSITYNDYVHTTKQDIINKLREAAAL